MPPVVPDAPWVINAAIILMAVLTPSWVTYNKVKQNTQKVDEVKAQVQNTHTTNLREDVDHVIRALERLEGYVVDLDTSLKAQGHSMDRKLQLHTEALANAEAERRMDMGQLNRRLARLEKGSSDGA